MDFRLEDRYIVIKRSDLDYGQQQDLHRFIQENAIPQRDSIVIEEDWPEYTPVCDMLFGRIDREASDRR